MGNPSKIKKNVATANGGGAGTLVPFGNSIEINPMRHLPQFDNGPAKAYSASDSKNPTIPYIALIADTLSLPRWNSVSVYNSLSDTSFIGLHKAGICNWTPEGVQKYAFIYRDNMGEALVDSSGFSKTQWRHPDIISLFMQPMARILMEMADKRFSHGAIRPNNIFHGSSNKDQPIILGDCLAAYPLSTQPPLFLTLDKALAEPFARGDCELSDDIYAFGVSLALFLRKNDGNAGLSIEEINYKKHDIGSFSTIVGGERFQESFIEILRGTLHDDVKLRWGIEEIFSWVDGTRVTPPPMVKHKKASRPISFAGNKYYMPDLLVLDLHKNPNELYSLVESGTLERWIEKSLESTTMLEAYLKSLENVEAVGNISENKDLLVTQLRMAFSASLPIYYKGRHFAYNGLGGLLAKTIIEGHDTRFFEEVIELNIACHDMIVKDIPQSDMMLYLKKLDACRVCIKQSKPGFGVERCVYILGENVPCLSPQFKGFFITGFTAILNAFEVLCQRGDGISLMLDRHSIAFFSILDKNTMEQCSYDLNSSNKDNKVSGNLRFFSIAQRRSNTGPYLAIADVFLTSIAGAYKKFYNRETRAYVKKGVKKAAGVGDLVGMGALLDDADALIRDEAGFKRAKKEYKNLRKEYADYDLRLANKSTYGVVNGRNVAAFVSMGVSMIIISIVVLSYFSGNRMF